MASSDFLMQKILCTLEKHSYSEKLVVKLLVNLHHSLTGSVELGGGNTGSPESVRQISSNPRSFELVQGVLGMKLPIHQQLPVIVICSSVWVPYQSS